MTNKIRAAYAVCTLLFLAVSMAGSAARAGELSIGAVGALSVTPYKSYDTLVMPFPIITYKSDRLFIKGMGAGVHLYKDETHELSVGASYLGLEFKPRRTDDRQLKLLDKRHSTMTADLTYSLVSPVGLFRTGVRQDVLGQSNGLLGNLSWHIPWITDSFTIMPGLGVEWASSKHNEHYYGLSGKEARRSGLNRYKPGSSFTPYATLEAKFRITGCWDLVAKGKLDWVPKRVQDSPMVGKSFATSIMAGVQYNF